MNWILMVKHDINLKHFAETLSQLGAELREPDTAVPLDEREVAIQVSGPRDLDRKLHGVEDVLAAYPDSDMDYAER